MGKEKSVPVEEQSSSHVPHPDDNEVPPEWQQVEYLRRVVDADE